MAFANMLKAGSCLTISGISGNQQNGFIFKISLLSNPYISEQKDDLLTTHITTTHMRLIHMQIRIMMIHTLGIRTLDLQGLPTGPLKILMLHLGLIPMLATHTPEILMPGIRMQERGLILTQETLMPEKEIPTQILTQLLCHQGVRS